MAATRRHNHNWIFSDYTNKTLYKCKKTITFSNYTQHSCTWEGTLAEYINHVKNQHSSSYFCIPNKSTKFEWKLPFVGDQTDLGIFQHSLGYFLYEIYFKESSREIYFSLAFLDNVHDNNIFYEFILHSNIKKESFVCQVNIKSDNLKPVHEQTHKIIIDKNVLSTFLDKNRMFQWYITLNNTLNAAPPTGANLFE